MTIDALDAGEQAERTALAWRRTGLAAIATGALPACAGPVPAGLPLITLGVLVEAVIAPLRYRLVVIAIAAKRSPCSQTLIAMSATAVGAACLIAAAGTMTFEPKPWPELVAFFRPASGGGSQRVREGWDVTGRRPTGRER